MSAGEAEGLRGRRRDLLTDLDLLVGMDSDQDFVELEKHGLKAVDALHGACAEQAGAEYFLTCDDRVIRRYNGGMKAISPVEFVLRMTGELAHDDRSGE